MRVLLGALILPLFACAMSDGDIAAQCGLDEGQLKSAFEDVQRLAPNQSRTVGRCTFTRGVGDQAVMVVITKTGRSAVFQ